MDPKETYLTVGYFDMELVQITWRNHHVKFVDSVFIRKNTFTQTNFTHGVN